MTKETTKVNLLLNGKTFEYQIDKEATPIFIDTQDIRWGSNDQFGPRMWGLYQL